MQRSGNFREHIQLLSDEWAAAGYWPGVKLFSIESDDLFLTITNYGLRMVHLLTEGAHDEPVDVIAGPETPRFFFQSTNPYYGAVIGRFANRIDRGRFSLNGVPYQLGCNNGHHHLHGGVMGFHNQVWECITQTEQVLVFSHTSTNGTEGYPGNLDVKVTFTVNGKRLKIEYEATTDATTIVNLTHHPFFNLNGCGTTNLEGHVLQLQADRYLPVRQDMIPEGTMSRVEGSPFDFRSPVLLVDRLQQTHEQLQRGHGFDHCFIRNGTQNREPELSATAWSQFTGVGMHIYTTEPGVQLYTGNFMDGTNLVKQGGADVFRSAFCLETQHFPDSPNHASFPSVVLEPGQVYQSSTIFEFFKHDSIRHL